ncbi:MAG TPA: hypothetical protein VFH54_02010 [Mycobacteriales bacterium]|nr:hypothetical protein [Mycobacteriales bacterium]
MTFWTGVAMTYCVIIAIGLSLGCFLATRYRRDGGGGQEPPAPAPAPTGPSHALEACPPLGTPFDRALLPGVFDAEPVSAI